MTFGFLILLISGVVFLALMVQERAQQETAPEVVAPPAPKAPPEPIPIPTDRRPIAILRLATTQGADAIEDYLRVGLAEDIASALTGVRSALVIPSHRTLSLATEYEEQASAASALGARFVVSTIAARSPGGLVFDITVYDAVSQELIGSEHTEFPVHDLPNIGGLLADKIGPIVDLGTATSAQVSSDTEMAAPYDLLLRARYAIRTRTQDSSAEAHKTLNRILEIESGFAAAHAHLALLELAIAHHGWSDDRRRSLDRAVEHAQTAVALDPSDPLSHLALGRAQLWNRGQLDIAIAAFESALAINPEDSAARAGLGFALTWSGNLEAASGHLEAVREISPDFPPDLLWYLGHAYFNQERFEDAVAVLKRFAERPPVHIPANLLLAASLGQSGRTEEGEAFLAALLQSQGNVAPSAFANVRDAPYRNPADMERYFAGLKKVGWR